MIRRPPMIAVLSVAAIVLIAGIVTVSVSGGSSKSANVSAVPSASMRPSPTATATPTANPTATRTATPSPTKTAGPTHFPITTRTPSSLHPKAGPSSAPVGVSPIQAACKVHSGTQTISGRSVIVDLPARFPAPVIFDFHGGNQSAAQEHAYTGLGPVGAGAGYLVVTPNGTGGLWNFPTTEALPDDVAYLQTVASLLAFAGCSNGRLYAAGISDGADMAVTAGCRIPEVRAVFAVAPSITPRGACTKKSFAEVHGTSDPVVPYEGSAPGSFPDTPSEAVAHRLPFWTSGCRPAPAVSPGAGTEVKAWTCPAGHTTRLYTISGGGHTWPGAMGDDPVGGLGARASWSADAQAVSFFSAN